DAPPPPAPPPPPPPPPATTPTAACWDRGDSWDGVRSWGHGVSRSSELDGRPQWHGQCHGGNRRRRGLQLYGSSSRHVHDLRAGAERLASDVPAQRDLMPHGRRVYVQPQRRSDGLIGQLRE